MRAARTMVKSRGILRQSITVADQVLSQVLDDHQRFVIVQDEDSNPRSSIPDSDSLILAKTSLRLCKHDNCSGCEDLHLCRYFVCGNCRFGTKCKNSHDLTSTHNSDLLEKHDLYGLAHGELFQLLLQNDPSLLPEYLQKLLRLFVCLTISATCVNYLNL
uniref:Poly [ADP-ribose] polymerase 12-like n=1 Tax=Sinocyclocheilus anshuiensis TaxID=1608454 RepID=A0A671M3Z6_9TELE